VIVALAVPLLRFLRTWAPGVQSLKVPTTLTVPAGWSAGSTKVSFWPVFFGARDCLSTS